MSKLVANALTHGEAAHPVELVVEGLAGETVRLEVRNQGMIPEDVLPVLFEPLRAATKRAGSSGVGLALYISQQIARAHEGELTVRSEAGATTFTLVLPRRPGAKATLG